MTAEKDVVARLKEICDRDLCRCVAVDAIREIEQLRKDLAIQAVNAKTVADLERALAETHDAWTAETERRLQAERKLEKLRHRMDRIEMLVTRNVTGCGTCTSVLEEIAFLRSHGDVTTNPTEKP